jgi:hypothetical protein
MKKIILTLFFLFSIFTLNNITVGLAETSTVDRSDDIFAEKFAQLQKEIYIKGLIQNIEMESEVIIPEYFDVKYVEYVYNLADTLEIPIRMAFRLIYRESSFRDTVVSPMGAGGLMQLMPDTRRFYRSVLRSDTLNLDKNGEDIYIGLNMVKDLYNYWVSRGNSEKYSWKLALASYNAGKGTVLKYKGVPPIKETTDFLAFILRAHSNPEFFASYIKKYENSIKDNS